MINVFDMLNIKLIDDAAVIDTNLVDEPFEVTSKDTYKAISVIVEPSNEEVEIVISQGEIMDMLHVCLNDDPEAMRMLQDLREHLFDKLVDEYQEGF